MTPKPTKAFAHQLVSIKHNDKSKLVFDLSDAGTGKTYVRIAGFAKRRAKGGKCLLVIAPRSLLRSVWFNDFRKFAPHLKVIIANADNREKAFAEDADVYVTNTDAAKWLGAQKKLFFAKFGELAIDESTAFKHHTSQRSKAMVKVARFLHLLDDQGQCQLASGQALGQRVAQHRAGGGCGFDVATNPTVTGPPRRPTCWSPPTA